MVGSSPPVGPDVALPLSGRTAVVTGAARGIGAAITHRLVAEGVRVVGSDRDQPEATGVQWVTADLSTASGVTSLVEGARDILGEIDLFVGNAGVEIGQSIEATDEAWQLSYDVNVLAHVRAARLLIPHWLERGSGRYVMTVSAAGLLTMLGSPAYTATKHAALAFGEWLSATYGHRGIVVQAICPQGVRTGMLPTQGPAAEILEREGVLEPADIADHLVGALEGEAFLVLPHPQVARYYAARANDTDRWLAAMRDVQRRIDDDGPTDRATREVP